MYVYVCVLIIKSRNYDVRFGVRFDRLIGNCASVSHARTPAHRVWRRHRCHRDFNIECHSLKAAPVHLRAPVADDYVSATRMLVFVFYSAFGTFRMPYYPLASTCVSVQSVSHVKSQCL